MKEERIKELTIKFYYDDFLERRSDSHRTSPTTYQASLLKRPGSRRNHTLGERYTTRGYSGFVLLASPPYSVFRPHSTTCRSKSPAPRKRASICEFHWLWRAATNVRSGIRWDAGIGAGISAAAFTRRSDKWCKLHGNMSVKLQAKITACARTQSDVVVFWTRSA